MKKGRNETNSAKRRPILYPELNRILAMFTNGQTINGQRATLPKERTDPDRARKFLNPVQLERLDQP